MDILRFRGLFESVLWETFEEDILKVMLENNRAGLETCPLDKVEQFRGRIKAIKDILSLKEDARTAYREKVSHD